MRGKIRFLPISAILCLLLLSAARVPLSGFAAGIFGARHQAKPDSVSAQLKALVLKEDLSIGAATGDEKYMFGSSVSINVDDAGNIYALDWDNKQVKKYGPDGKHILTFGRAGQGPGEFRNPSGVRFTKDGNLYISENFGRKIMFYDPRGIYLDQTSLPETMFDIWITPAGTYLGNKQVAPRYVGEGPVETFIVLYNSNFQPILELHKESFTFPDFDGSPAKSQAAITTEFLNRPAASAVMGEDGRIYFGRNDKYAVDVYAPEGRKLQTISRDVAPAPYEKKDIDFLLKEYGEGIKSILKSEPDIKEYLRLLRFPKYKPLFRALIPMEEGRLAVVVESEGQDSTWLDIFDRGGLFLGRVKAPVRITMFKKGKAYTVRRDEEDFLSIKRYAYELK